VGERHLEFREALNEAVRLCMEADERVYLIGLGAPDPTGIFGSTKGLLERFGARRVYDMPVSENAMTGVVLGSSLVGMRPVMTHMRQEFALPAIDQIVNHAAKWHYTFGAQPAPLVLRIIVGRGWGQGPQHSQSLHAWFSHIPGLKVVMPATPHDAKGLLIASIEDDNPVIFLEHRWLYSMHGPVPEGLYRVPLGQPKLMREGEHATVVSLSYMSLEALRASEMLAREGIEVDLIDLRTLSPLDDTLILESVARTGRLVVCDHATITGGFAGEIVARVCEQALDRLVSAPVRVAMPDCPAPTTRALSNYYYPRAPHIAAAVKRSLGLPAEDPDAGVAPGDLLDVPDPSFTGPF
jgi:acetoin:2,6-dichlorophenolindophenol oxidoreductase subunit beta